MHRLKQGERGCWGDTLTSHFLGIEGAGFATFWADFFLNTLFLPLSSKALSAMER